MKPVLCPKTGYSLKDTFIMLIKCLVLSLTFIFIGVAKTDKVEAADYFIIKYNAADNLYSTTCYATNSSGGCSKIRGSQTSNATYHAIQAYVTTTNALASIRTMKVVANGTTYTWSDSAIASNKYINLVFMNRTSVYKCSYSASSVCSSAPSGLTMIGATLLLPYSYMSKSLTISGGGKYLGKDYSAANTTVTIGDGVGPDLSSVTITNSSSGNWTKSNVTVKLSGATDRMGTISKYHLCYMAIGGASLPQEICTDSTSGSFTFSTEVNRTYYVGATDSNGVKSVNSNKTTAVKIDKTAPTLTGTFAVIDGDTSNNATTPASGYTNSTKVKVSSLPTVTDTGGSGLHQYRIIDSMAAQASLDVYALSTTAPTTSTTGNIRDLEATSGSHYVIYRVYDRAGNVAYMSYSIVYDKTSPKISSFSAADGDSSNDAITPASGYTNSQTVKFTLDASDTNLWKYSVYDYNGTSIYALSTTSPNTKTATLCDAKETDRTLQVIVYDKAGNLTYANYSIFYDGTAPAISAFNVADGDSSNDAITPMAGYTNSQKLQFSARASDNSKIYLGKVMVGSSTLLGSSYPGRSTTTLDDSTMQLPATDGTHTLTWYIYDYAGNVTTAETSITYDATAPTIDEFKAEDNDTSNNAIAPLSGYTNEVNLAFTASMSDATAGIKQSGIYEGEEAYENMVYITEGGFTSQSGELPGDSPTEGSHTLILYVYDKAGNVATKSYSIVYDATAPTISAFKAEDNDLTNNAITPYSNSTIAYTNSTSIKYTQTITETNKWKYKVLDGTIQIYALSTTAPTTDTLANTTEGTHILTLYVYDKAGNVSTKTYNVVYDVTRPVLQGVLITIDGDKSNDGITPMLEVTNSTTIKFKDIPTSSDSNLWKYKMVSQYESVETTLYALSTTNIAVSATGTISDNEGEHIITYSVYDKAGNVKEGYGSVILDKTASTIETFIALGNDGANDGYTNQKELTITQESSDTFGVWKYKILDGTTEIYSLSTTAPTVVELGSSTKGTHTLTLYVYDTAGNVSSKAFNIFYDPDAPVITGFSAADNDMEDNKNHNGVVITPSAGYTNSAFIKFAQTSYDAEGGSGIFLYKVTDYAVSIYGPSSYNPANESAYLYIDRHVNHVLTLYVYDKAGNISTATYTIYYDTIAPEIGTFSLTGNSSAQAGYTNQKELTVSQESSDEGGIREYLIEEGSTKLWNHKTNSPNAQIVKLASETNGVRTLGLYVYDYAGNESLVKNATIVFDNVKQTVLLNGQSSQVSGVNPGSKLLVTVTDDNERVSTYTMGYYVSVNDEFVEGSTYEVNTNSQTSGITVSNYTSGYYVYLFVRANDSSKYDKAGNPIVSDIKVGEYLVKKIKVIPTANKVEGYKDPVDAMWDKVVNNSSDIELHIDANRTNTNAGMLYATDKEVTEENPLANVIQIQANKFLIITLNSTSCGRSNETPELSKILSEFGLTLIGKAIATSTGTSANMNRVLANGDTFSVLSIIVIDNSAHIACPQGNAGSVVVEQGSDVNNIGLALIEEDENVEVETLITLDGVKVEEVDTNVAGVYSIRQVAKDKQGRTKTLQKEIIVEASKIEEVIKEEAKEEAKEEIIEQDKIELVEVKVVEQTKEAPVEARAEVEVENNKVEMRIEKKAKVRGYKKRKEIKKVNKETFTFKLFSKYFFKIYDG